MLVNNEYLLKPAFEKQYAVGAFNAINMEQIQGIIEAAEEERAPVILQASQGAIRYAGLNYITSMAINAAKTAKIPVSLHLDHGTSFIQNVVCLRAGFTSLMFDGSKLPYKENVKITQKVVEMAHPVNVSVEAELGCVLRSVEKPKAEEITAHMTCPKQAQEFVKLTGVNSLAVAVGSVHGMNVQAAQLDIDRIRTLKKNTKIPLVLHGASGVTDESIVKGIREGICKINVATALNIAFIKGLKEGLSQTPNEIDFRKILTLGKNELKKVVKEKIRLFGSNDKV